MNIFIYIMLWLLIGLGVYALIITKIQLARIERTLDRLDRDVQYIANTAARWRADNMPGDDGRINDL